MRAICIRLVDITERILTRRARRKARSRLKQSRKHPVRDWIEAFLQAALLVLLINQFLLQAYRIPSGSMIRTFIEGDRIFVNKVIYGPELLPGLTKLPGFARPQQNEVIIFLNPSYISRGPLFTVAQRTIYMLTLSLVDIDRDAISDEARAQLLIKRAVGAGGDRFKNDNLGNLLVMPAGTDRWMRESEYQTLTDRHYDLQRLLSEEDYALIHEGGRALALNDLGLPLTEEERANLDQLRRTGIRDPFEFERVRQGTLAAAAPHVERYQQRYHFVENGWYVPDNRVFGLGDNRDNSRDGRYFGPVQESNVLGRAMVIYWPIDRIGRIR
ncbi:MAG: signal peptidase I [Spirochaetaceae bacterium]|nr:MAG: signal peptidase I [Spirochaetaceae bacterium]